MKLIIAGGGTGGHLFPGIAIAEEVRARGGDVLFVGTAAGIEARVVPEQGWPLQLIEVSGLKRKGLFGFTRGLGKLPGAFLSARRIVREFAPELVLGVGGYASGPVVLAAAGRVPTAILEQNSVPGVTNRMLGRVVGQVFGAFEESRRFFPAKKFVLAGNPIRRAIRDALLAAGAAAPAAGPVRLFVCGGSQGAQAVNERVCEAVALLARRGIPLRVLHQTGAADLEATRARYLAAGIDADVRAFIQDMASAYRDADLVVARAGATTIAELTAIGRATVFIPFPFAADDHQTVNARSLVDAGAARSFAQDAATGAVLAETLAELARAPETRAKMAQLMRERGKPEAAREIVIPFGSWLVFRKKDTHIHFVGVGGIGMSGIAEVLLNLGYQVSGSDLKESETTRRLTSLGCQVGYGHDGKHVGDCDVVVISSAVKATNPEVVEARARMIPVIPRAEMLAELMRMKFGVAVAGSHGKTTTTSLIAAILGAAGLDPTVVIGGKVNSMGTNARLGQGEYLVAEADESDGSFLKLSPTVAVVTNIDPEHLDHYGDLAALKRAFVDFVNRVPFYGQAVLCADHPNVRAILPLIEKRHVTYGLSRQADWRADNVRFDGLSTRFDAYHGEQRLGEVTVAMPGVHNALNSLAVLAVADFLDVPFETTRSALASFAGVQRRFTIRGEAAGVMVVDDYGHHPTEIRATLAAARPLGRRVVAAFQPHRYTRTRDLLDDFAEAFDDAAVVLVSEIYGAGEDAIPGVTAARLVERMRAHGHKQAIHVGARSELIPALVGILKPGDLVITQGAGDITRTADELLAKLRG